jgi:hypothetical protein
MHVYFKIVFIGFVLLSCQKQKRLTSFKNEFAPNFPVVLDTFEIEKFLIFQEKEVQTHLSFSKYPIYYIGLVKDSIFLQAKLGYFNVPPPNPSTQEVNEIFSKNFNNDFKKQYEVLWNELIDYRTYKNARIDIQYNPEIKFSNSFPVMISNLTTDTIDIAFNEEIPLIIEGIDSLGNWRPIQQVFSFFCALGSQKTLLPLKDCIVTLAPMFQEDNQTQLLTSGNKHSKPNASKIYYSQFYK